MQYLGGKSKIAKQVAGYLNRIRKPEQVYWEPFVGAGWILACIRGDGLNYASDANAPLIEMWQALRGGWVPPGVVSEAEYKRAKDGELGAALTAFIGFGSSFGGKWFGGYAREGNGGGRNYARESKNKLLEKIGQMQPCNFFVEDFTTCPPPAQKCLIYCDSPYDGTTGYGAVGKFDSLVFWERIRELESEGHTCVISEYQAPGDFTCVWSQVTKTGLSDKDKNKHSRIERLFRLGEHPQVQYRMF